MKIFSIQIPEDAGFALVALALMLPAIVYPLARKWDGHFFSQENCWKVQEVSGHFFKVNTCSGEVEEIKDISTESATTK